MESTYSPEIPNKGRTFSASPRCGWAGYLLGGGRGERGVIIRAQVLHSIDCELVEHRKRAQSVDSRSEVGEAGATWHWATILLLFSFSFINNITFKAGIDKKMSSQLSPLTGGRT